MRIVRGNSADLEVTFYNDETPVDAGAVTVTVKDASGETVQSGAGVAGSETGDYTFTLEPRSTLGALTVTWAGSNRTVTTDVEVVGNDLFTLSEARTQQESLANAAKYSTSYLKGVRDDVSEEFERITNRSFVPRVRRERVRVQGGSAFLPSVDVTKVISVDGQAFTGGWTSYGEVQGLSNGHVVIEYEYGFPQVPADIKRAAILRTRHLAAAPNSGIPDRATSYTPENGGSYTLAVAGRAGFETGIPDVDAVLARYKFNTLGAV